MSGVNNDDDTKNTVDMDWLNPRHPVSRTVSGTSVATSCGTCPECGTCRNGPNHGKCQVKRMILDFFIDENFNFPREMKMIMKELQERCSDVEKLFMVFIYQVYQVILGRR